MIFQLASPSCMRLLISPCAYGYQKNVHSNFIPHTPQSGLEFRTTAVVFFLSVNSMLQAGLLLGKKKSPIPSLSSPAVQQQAGLSPRVLLLRRCKSYLFGCPTTTNYCSYSVVFITGIVHQQYNLQPTVSSQQYYSTCTLVASRGAPTGTVV